MSYHTLTVHCSSPWCPWWCICCRLISDLELLGNRLRIDEPSAGCAVVQDDDECDDCHANVLGTYISGLPIHPIWGQTGATLHVSGAEQPVVPPRLSLCWGETPTFNLISRVPFPTPAPTFRSKSCLFGASWGHMPILGSRRVSLLSGFTRSCCSLNLSLFSPRKSDADSENCVDNEVSLLRLFLVLPRPVQVPKSTSTFASILIGGHADADYTSRLLKS